MINEDKYKEVLDSGLLLDHYFVLLNIRDGAKLADSRRVQGFLNLLKKRGYLSEDDELTEKGTEFLQTELQTGTLRDRIEAKNNSKTLAEYALWVSELHSRIQKKLQDLTGKKQVMAKIERKSYSFLCNITDLGKVLRKTMLAYKIDDREKIEKTIMAYIDKCNDSNNWFPILMYYINKFGVSQMVTDMESMDDSHEEDYKSTQKFA